jgi:tRNA (cmo5U34)-methyltransferase
MRTWDFESVAGTFDTYVRGQLPWYDLVSDGIVEIARHYLPEGGLVYDIGASNGNIGRRLSGLLEERHAELVAIEREPAFSETYDAPGELKIADAAQYQYGTFDLAVCCLSLMFISVEVREVLLQTLLRHTNPGGAVIIVERFLPQGSGYSAIVTSRMTMAGTRTAGIPAEEIVDKELSLSGAQRPLSVDELADTQHYEWFRMGDFAGYVIEAGHMHSR